jgi:superfamily I DNA/RNA helicase
MYIYDEDDEARVFYVGLTRAKKRLHLIHPMVSKGYDIPH